MRSLNALRLFLELLIALALSECAVAFARVVLAGDLGADLGEPSVALLHAAGVVLVAGPLFWWRIAAATRSAAPAEDPAREPARESAETWAEMRGRTAVTSHGQRPEDQDGLIDTAIRRQAEIEQAAALSVTTALARAVDVAEAAEAVNDALERSTGLARTAVLLYEDDGVCRFVGWRGLSAEYRRAVEGHCPWAQDAPEAEPILKPDVSADATLAPYRDLFRRERIGALAFVPVVAKTGVVGKLMLYGATPGSITPAAVRAARVVAVFLGTAVTRLRMADALAKSESRLRAVIDTAMDAVVSIDASGRVVGWNAQAEVTFGWTAAEALGRALHELIIPEELRALHLRGLANHAATGESTVLGKRNEVPAVRKDGTRITVELAITPVHTSEGVLFNGFLRDITAAKRAADELLEARTAAESANRAKSEFLANMSHEIRTPLTAILGYAELLRDDGDLTRAPERRIETIDTIQGAGQHLLTVINDILDISKIEAGKMTVEAIETQLVGILQEVESLLRPRAAEKGVTLTTRLVTPLYERVMSDPTRLRQILMNLVGNAVKFTAEGGITVAARAEEREGSQRLVIDVEDTGAGLTRAQAARIFSSFNQADASVTRRYGGSGLGLPISHRLAGLLGGSVSLQRTEPGKGSCFRLELPLVPAPGAVLVASLEEALARTSVRALSSAGSAPALAGRILLAEDGRDNQTIIAFHLRKAGAEVDIAGNGRVALEMLEHAAAAGRPYDLLLTDIQMPELDGYTLARALRDCGNRIAIVALTAHAMAEDRQRCLDAGCDDYAVKPIDKAKLLATCAQWLGKSGGAPGVAA